MSKLFPMPPEFKNLVDQILYLLGVDLNEAIKQCEKANDLFDFKELLKLLRDYKDDSKK